MIMAIADEAEHSGIGTGSDRVRELDKILHRPDAARICPVEYFYFWRVALMDRHCRVQPRARRGAEIVRPVKGTRCALETRIIREYRSPARPLLCVEQAEIPRLELFDCFYRVEVAQVLNPFLLVLTGLKPARLKPDGFTVPVPCLRSPDMIPATQ